MTATRSAAPRPALLLAGLLLAAAATRPQLVGIGPLLGRIQQDLGVSHATVGLLGTIPVLCMGIFAPLGPKFINRWGVTGGIAICIALIAFGGLARVAVDSFAVIVLFTFVVGLGMGAMGSAMPVVVAEMRRGGRTVATALYITGINLGAAASSAATVPLAQALGGWRASMAVVSAVTVLLIGAWAWAARNAGLPARAPGTPPRRLRGDRRLWLLIVLFTSTAVCYYGAVSWLADAYVERGWSEAEAGALVAVLNLLSLVGALLMPLAADRFRTRRASLLVVGSMYAVGFAVLAGIPELAWAAVVPVGLANGGLFVLVMLLPLDFAEDPSQVGVIAGAMLGAGYTLAAISPVILGGVRDAAGTYSIVLWVLAASGAVFVAGVHVLYRIVARAEVDP
jgi:CP family cyanate transporter-like MFS transporter